MPDRQLYACNGKGAPPACGLFLLVMALLVGLCGAGSRAQSSLGGNSAAAPAAPTMVDDSDLGWMWKGMTKLSDPSLYGGTAHAGGTGSSAIYTFEGTGADIIGVAGQSLSIDGKLCKVGSAKVTVDGNPIATINLIRRQEMYSFNIFSVTGLPMGNHVLEVTADDGWIAIDCLRVHKDKMLPTAASTNESSTTSSISQFSKEKIWTDGVNTYISFDFLGPYVHFRTYWDTDLNSATGYAAGNGVGAEYLVEDTTLYKSTSNGPAWNWIAETAAVTSTISQNRETISIPGCPPHANVLIQALDANWTNAATDTNIVRFSRQSH